MKMNLKDKSSPCVTCYMHSGFSFSEHNASCQKCEYNIAIQLLKRVLKDNDYCQMCNHVEKDHGEFYCKFDYDKKDCLDNFSINWEKACWYYDMDYEN